jgi:hypothetical protein
MDLIKVHRAVMDLIKVHRAVMDLIKVHRALMDLIKVHRAVMDLIAESPGCCGLTPCLIYFELISIYLEFISTIKMEYFLI